MTLPPNVEKSAFFPKTYVAYDARGFVWHVRRHQQAWRAKPAPSNPARALVNDIEGSTLTTVALAVAQRKSPVPYSQASEPF